MPIGRMQKKIFLFFSLLAAAARADNSVKDAGAPWPTTVDMARATAMGGAGAAVATSNDALVTNPAGLSQARRYHFEIDGVYDSHFPAEGVIASIVDTASSPIGSGILFSRWGSGQPGGRGEGWGLGFAYSGAIGQALYMGGQSKFLRFRGPDGLTAKWAQDVGFLSRRGNFSWAAVVQNISTEKLPLFPLTATAGLAWGNDADWRLAFDYKADLSDTSNVKHKAALGAEVLIEQSIALRGGATWDPSAQMWWASAGLGLLTEKGGLNLVWRRRVSGGFDQLLEAGLTLYLE
ncbi:MAG: hypothetical protein ACXWLM_04360 [Myxococcales bacterium]